jgi:hypothetical protein
MRPSTDQSPPAGYGRFVGRVGALAIFLGVYVQYSLGVVFGVILIVIVIWYSLKQTVKKAIEGNQMKVQA